jgi:hypothetical protein
VFVKRWVSALAAIAVCSATAWAAPAGARASSSLPGDDASVQQWQKAILVSQWEGEGAAVPGQAVPSALPQRQDPGQGVADLPGLPSTLLLSLAGFLCVTLIRDRRAWLAIPFALFAAFGSLGRAVSREAGRSEANQASTSSSVFSGVRAGRSAPDAGRYLTKTEGLVRQLLVAGGNTHRFLTSASIARDSTCLPAEGSASPRSYLLVGLLSDSGFASVGKPSVSLTFQRAPPLWA